MPDFAPNIAVPAQDAADNDTSGDVIGNKTDTNAGDSLYALGQQMGDYLVGTPVVTFPELSAGGTLTAGAANAYGAAVELAAAGDVAVDSRLASCCIRTPSGAMTGKIEFGTGAGPTYICEVDFEIASDAAAFVQMNLVGMGGVIPTGSAISARHKSTAGGTTVDVSVGFMDALV